MSNLRTALNQLASSFASNVLDAIRGASLQEILAESGSSHAGRYSAGAGAAGLPARRGPGRPPSSSLGLAPAPSAGAGRGRRRGRLARRSAGDISQIVNSIVQLLEGSSEGLRAEQIRAALSLEAKELPRPIAEALASKRIIKQGQKRATTYFARGKAGAAGKSAGKTAGKSAKKSAGKAASAANASGAKKSGRGPGRPAGSGKAAKKSGAKRGRPAKNASAESAASSTEASV